MAPLEILSKIEFYARNQFVIWLQLVVELASFPPNHGVESMVRTIFLSIAVAIGICSSFCSEGQSQDLVVFGDSLSDTGNFSILNGGMFPPPNLYYQGRISNGPIWTDYFAPSVGLQPPTPALNGGTNFAFNGSRAIGVSPYGTPDLATQVGQYLLLNGGVADSSDVFVIWAGANDIYFGSAFGEPYAIENALLSIESSVRSLYAAGARKFIVLNLPPLGDTPYFEGAGEIATQLDWAAFQFDVGLWVALWFAECDLKGIEIAQVDMFSLFSTVKRNPRRFQIDNTEVACTIFDPTLGSIGIALRPGTNPARSLFWDGVHPTSRAHEIIASRVKQVARMRLSPLHR